MSESPAPTISFNDLDLPAPLRKVLDDVGYETPSPIQAQAIPHLLKGLDIVGRAPTGTGKTAAFALPLLARLDMKSSNVQVLVLTPTRELAIQVAEAFQRYASRMKGFHVVPIYGGQAYDFQNRMLRRGVHVVVGTPGRVMDHIRKGRLKLDNLQALVLDEADEMLRMGFIDDVEWILEHIPDSRQMALFSATMPQQIRRIAKKYLNDPQEVSIKAKTATADTIRQRFLLVNGGHKLDALTRILEVEEFDAMLIFVRTKIATANLAEKLAARGFAAAALNGDMAQKSREQMIEQLKNGKLDLLVATDVAARGLDVERISHVINYDIPYGTESYIHRIGRTGRAGRSGEAILFVASRERRMLHAIEKATRQKIDPLQLPSMEMVSKKRVADFSQRIVDMLEDGDVSFMKDLLVKFQVENGADPMDIAAALGNLALGERLTLLMPPEPGAEREQRRLESRERRDRDGSSRDSRRDSRERRSDRPGDKRDEKRRGKRDEKRSYSRTGSEHAKDETSHSDFSERRSRERSDSDNSASPEMEQYRIEVGSVHDVKPGNIVGAIANESGLDAKFIGHIDIRSDYSVIDLPEGMPREIFDSLKKVWVSGQKLSISRMNPGAPKSGRKKSSSGPGSGRRSHGTPPKPRKKKKHRGQK